jgi:cellobiose phosphorylase
MKMYGQFEQNGREFCITERKTPRHWYNYFYNDTYNAFTSQVGVGEGLAQDGLGRRVRLVNNRSMYLTDKDSKTWWSANGYPFAAKFDTFRCRHGLGYTVTESEINGVYTEYTVFVPLQGNREQWFIKVVNKRATKANLSAIAYAGTNTDGAYAPQGYNTDVGGFDHTHQATVTRLFTTFGTGKESTKYGYLISDGEVIGYNAAKNGFIGTYGTESCPEALEDHNGCTNEDCVGEKLCFAQEVAMVLEPGESRTVHFEIGFADSVAEVGAMRAHLAPGVPETELENMKAHRLSEISGANITTPDPLLNKAFNGFYKYTTCMGSRWARVRHNGYRDLMSDAECVSAFDPKLAWERYKRILTFQYSNGYAPRTFINGKINDNNFSDCAVWITFTGYAIVKELGDLNLLNEEVAFNDGTVATVYEHMRRSVDFLYNFKGDHGLIKIWGGDWNDCMNQAGVKGKGVSIWLSIAWYRANRMLIELAGEMGYADDVAKHKVMGEEMNELIHKYGWDGKYFITAINDDGMKIGSHENEEGKMYLNPQLWAVMSGVATEEEIKTAFKEVDDYLDEPLGTVVSKPPYTKLNTSIGSMTKKAAGLHENGGVYLHSMAWKLAVDGMLHRPDKIEAGIKKILPWDHTYADTCGEPYMLYNSYFGAQTGYRYGTPGQSWRSASTAWFVKSMLLYVFGLQPELDGLHIRPCLPPSWNECAVEKEFRGCKYVIRYHQTPGAGYVTSMTADGVAVEGEVLPYRAGATITVDVNVG